MFRLRGKKLRFGGLFRTVKAMRLRIKFTKTGQMRYISHLDIMRYFQKALRRAQADVAMSEGFSPHMLMSFALPLSLGMTSIGEYFDVDMNSVSSTAKLMEDLNRETGEDVRVLYVGEIPQDKANKCMAQVEAADYTVNVYLKDGDRWDTGSEETKKQIEDFLRQDTIVITKKTKKKESQVNIRPLVFSFTADEEGFHLRLKAGSTDHVKCAVVMERFLESAGIEADFVDLRRDELLLLKDGEYLPLYTAGKEIL